GEPGAGPAFCSERGGWGWSGVGGVFSVLIRSPRSGRPVRDPPSGEPIRRPKPRQPNTPSPLAAVRCESNAARGVLPIIPLHVPEPEAAVAGAQDPVGGRHPHRGRTRVRPHPRQPRAGRVAVRVPGRVATPGRAAVPAGTLLLEHVLGPPAP